MNTIRTILNAALLTGIFTAATAATTTTDESAEKAAPAAEKSWTNTGSIGLTIPVSKYEVHGHDVQTTGFGVDLNYIGIGSNGFSIEASFTGGATGTNDVKLEGSKDDTQIGRFSTIDFGLGYTLNIGKNSSLSVFSTIGFEFAYFEGEKNEFEHEELGKVDRYFSKTYGGLTLGGDVVYYKGLTDRTGFYASLAGRWMAETVTLSTVNYEKDDDTRTDTRTDSHAESAVGHYSIVPAAGAMFKF